MTHFCKSLFSKFMPDFCRLISSQQWQLGQKWPSGVDQWSKLHIWLYGHVSTPILEVVYCRGLFRNFKSRVPLELYQNLMGSKHQSLAIFLNESAISVKIHGFHFNGSRKSMGSVEPVLTRPLLYKSGSKALWYPWHIWI